MKESKFAENPSAYSLRSPGRAVAGLDTLSRTRLLSYLFVRYIPLCSYIEHQAGRGTPATAATVANPKPVVHDPALCCFDVAAAAPPLFCSFPPLAVMVAGPMPRRIEP